MAIDFSNLTSTTTTPVAPVEVTPAAPGITLNLEKNAVLDLAKVAPGLTNAKLCAGWDVSAGGAQFDLDISVFMLNSAGKITSGNDVVFYNHPEVPGVKLEGDNRTGAGEGDDETINLDLNAVNPAVAKIVCCITIDQAMARRQTFGMVNNSYVRLVNKETDQELCRFPLKDDYSTDTAVIAAELVRNGNGWAFHSIGEGKQADLNGLAATFQ